MALSYTYNQLLDALQKWPKDSDSAYVSDLPQIIQMGELRLARELNLELWDVRDTSQSVTAAATRAARLITKPTDTIVVRDVMLALDGVIVAHPELRSRSFIDRYAPDPTQQGKPRYYCEESATQLQLAPTPDEDYDVIMLVMKRPADGFTSSSGNTTSWLSTRVPDALFAACLMEAEQYLKADDRYADYRTKYYQELLPTARTELRNAMRRGDFIPPIAVAQVVG